MCEGGGNCLKYLKREWNRAEGRGHKNIKRGRQTGSRGGFYKKGGGWNPLTNYACVVTHSNIIRMAFVRGSSKFFSILNIYMHV